MWTISVFRDGEAPFRVELPDGVHVIGSGERCHLRLEDPTVSRRHAILTLAGSSARIEDMGSENGTFVNATPADSRGTVVSPTTPVTIGPYTLVVAPAAAPAASSAATGSGLSDSQPEGTTASYDPAGAAGSDAQPRCDAPARPSVADSADSPPELRRESQPSVPPPLAMSPEVREIKRQIHGELVHRLDVKRLSVSRARPEEVREKARATISSIIEEVRDRLPPELDPEALRREILAEAIGLGPLEDLLADDSVSEIMVNGPFCIYVERGGRLTRTDRSFMDEDAELAAIDRIVAPLGRRVDESQPYVDARLPDGSRVNCVIHPLSLVGPCITIRKFSRNRLFAKDLVAFGTMTAGMAEFLRACVAIRKNIVVSGGTGSGKTTLLNVLSHFLPDTERILTIEDAAELRLDQPHLVRLEARPPNIEGTGAVTIRDLVRNALRMRPDRIIVGECRGGEALDMLQAMNTGHDGSLTTVHANSPRDVVSRLETMVLMSGLELPSRAIREQIASAVDIVVHESRLSDGSRKVVCISEVTGLEGDCVTMQDLFVFRQTGIDAEGRVTGRFEATGAVPSFYSDLAARGISLDISLFSPPPRAGAAMR